MTAFIQDPVGDSKAFAGSGVRGARMVRKPPPVNPDARDIRG
jgi:hypothetical protein